MRCGNFERSCIDGKTWVFSQYGIYCPDCGAETVGVVRNNDLSPRLKVRAHDAPPGVTPSPYGVHERGCILTPAAREEM